MPSSPFSSSGPASDDGEQQLMSSPTPALSAYAHHPSSQPSVWLPPIHQQMAVVVDNNLCHPYHQIQCHYQHQDLPSDGSSSFDDIDAYGAEAAAAAEQGVWEGDDVEAFFTTASAFLLPQSGHHLRDLQHEEAIVLEEEFGLLGHHGGHAREEEAQQLMWCSMGVEDILSANKGEEWIDNLLQGCN
jgi:hypothetical protein